MSDPVLADGEALRASFRGNFGTYVKEHVLLAALGSVLMAGGLMVAGNPYPWTGVVGAVLAIGVRGVYVASEQLGMTWHLTDNRLIGPDGRTLPLSDVANVRVIFSAVQVITRAGDKYLLKYQADTTGTKARIDEARR